MKHTTCYTTILSAFAIVIAATWAVLDAQAAETWTASLTATSNDPLAETLLLRFGVDTNATDGFDIGLDLPAPPAPPSSIKLNAYFLCSHQFVKQLKTDIRKSVDTVNWQLSARADSDGFTLSWDISSIPAALSVMMGIGEESMDMRNLSSRSFSSGTYILTITVGVNDPPVVGDIPDVSFPEDGSNSSIDLDGYVADPDNTDAQITWTYAGNTNVNVSIDSVTRVVTFTSTLNWYGSETITFTATDPGSLSDSDPMTVTVSAVNDPPVVSDIPHVHFDEDNSHSSTDLDGYVYDPDDTDAEITWTYTGNTNVNVTINPANHVATFTASPDWHGSETIIFTASDPDGLSDSDAVTVTVDPVNDAPLIISSPVITAIEDSLYAYDVEATDADVGDVLTYYLTSSPNGMTIDAVSGLIQWTPTNDQVGSNSVVVWVKDIAEAMDFQAFNVIVVNVNDPPVAYDTSVSTDEDTSVAISLTGSDIDGDPLAYHIVSNPTNGILTGSAPDLIYTPSLNFHGSDGFTFKVNDGAVDSNTASVSISVTPVNDPPVAYDQLAVTDENAPVAIILTGSDIDGDSITYHIASYPSNGLLTGTASDLTYTPNVNFSGIDSFTFIVNDSVADSNTATVRIVVGDFFIHDMYTGWNLISLPLYPLDKATDPDAVLSSLNGRYNSVWAYEPNTGWLIYAPGAPSDLTKMEPGKGYWVKMDQPGTLIVRGSVPEQTALPLEGEAWNLVGYSSLEPRNAEDCMRNVENDINSVWEYNAADESWSIYSPGGPSDLGVMKPGYGYWIKADQYCEWDINAGSSP